MSLRKGLRQGWAGKAWTRNRASDTAASSHLLSKSTSADGPDHSRSRAIDPARHVILVLHPVRPNSQRPPQDTARNPGSLSDMVSCRHPGRIPTGAAPWLVGSKPINVRQRLSDRSSIYHFFKEEWTRGDPFIQFSDPSSPELERSVFRRLLCLMKPTWRLMDGSERKPNLTPVYQPKIGLGGVWQVGPGSRPGPKATSGSQSGR